MIEPLRPAVGILPGDIDLVIGRKARVDIDEGEPITWEKL
jgi:sialic acid synthase SpsE